MTCYYGLAHHRNCRCGPVPRATLDRLFLPDVIPYVEVLIVRAEPDAPLQPVIDVTLVPKK